MIRRVVDLLEALTIADVVAAAPARRRRFADLCRHWPAKADPPATERSTGIQADLKRGERSA